MNKAKMFLAALFAVCFVSCIQINEEVEIKEDGSGKLTIKSDMGKLFEMLKSFAGEEELKKEGMDRALDTTIYMKDMVDTATNITKENKALLRNGVMNLKMNIKENLFKLDMNYPFKNLSDANKLYSAMSGNGMMGNVLKGLNPNAGGQGDGADNAGIEKISSIYDVAISPGKYSRTLNKARYDSLLNDPKVQESRGMMAMMEDMQMNLTVKLPKAAKNVSNPKATLSPDKKTVMLMGGLMNALDSPQNLEIVIQY
ncbi:hypothetical protein [Flavihumibacter solisilvae]|uniref:Uncharacterized protein n=1 Tax=Flavihumibacter solisilvae TaxID=1349421 RepID=A0A0C1IW58_9BACT|nr:hypothetical protein [Flavihumibacter solisilvae]KIC94719.1 hypothetical protein OI18_09530 [Flavihumibacter solisilvae]